jgi:GNAT superfamily N-acetyltransferase
MRLFEVEDTSVRELEQELNSKYDLSSLSLSVRGDVLYLHVIIVGQQGQGTGSAAMRDIVDYADQHGLTIYLNPAQPDDFHGTTSRQRLVNFYKRFGFYENKGRKKDYRFQGGMIRDPR